MKIIYLIVALSCTAFPCLGQQSDSASKKWEIEASLNFYFVPDDFFVLPVVSADRNKLHLESRYNYEDRQTISFFAGYNFSGGKKLEYTITPMLGVVAGNSDGIAPGLELDLLLGKFGLYSEMEYLFEFNSKENNFYYNWSELTFAPKDWFWFGISGQRTRLYQTSLDIQRGLMTGFQVKNFTLTGYLFNPFSPDYFGIMTFAVQF